MRSLKSHQSRRVSAEALNINCDIRKLGISNVARMLRKLLSYASVVYLNPP
jgi:hypothetical protein